MALAFHVRFRLHTGDTLADSRHARWAFARSADRIGARAGLVAFSAPGDHAHFLLAGCTRSDAGKFAHDLECSHHFQLPTKAPFRPAWIGEISDADHLDAAFSYVLANVRKHGTDQDPTSETSSAHDLLGIRRLAPRTTHRALEVFPRVDLRSVALAVWGTRDLGVGTDARLLAGAAAAVAGADLRGTGCPSSVRIAAAHIGHADGLASGELQARLSVSSRHLRRMLGAAPDAQTLRAIRAQLWLLERAERARSAA